MDLNDYELKHLGSTAKALIELHLEDSAKFGKKFLFEILLKEYERMVSKKLG